MQAEPEFKIAVVGSGPAGMSAAGRAAALDLEQGAQKPSYILLEGFEHASKTIYRYQKGKHVMAEPGYLQLRSDFDFEQGTRENILGVWNQGLDQLSVNIRYNAAVKGIEGSKGNFSLKLADGSSVTAANIILAIGTEGNPRMLGVENDDLPRVQYQLDDPAEFSGETIIVVGAGDSAVENALALAKQNKVYILNRKDEFARIKDGNRDLLLAAVSNPKVDFDCYYKTTVGSVNPVDGSEVLDVVLNTPDGDVPVQADRIIARLGSIPPRGFLESCGIELPSSAPTALPELSDEYETNNSGIYVIGSLAGYPLIKQAMNQGYDVVEFISGNKIQTIEQQLLEYQFTGFPYESEADEMARILMSRVPMFNLLNVLAFRELIIESDISVSYADPEAGQEAIEILDELRQRIAAESEGAALPKSTLIIDEGSEIYAEGDFGVSFFTILDGEVILESERIPGGKKTLGQGLFFGETSLIAGQPRQETAIAGSNCIVMETPRRTILKLMSSNENVKNGIDWVFVVRELQRLFAPTATVEELRPFADQVKQNSFTPGSIIWEAGDEGDSVHVIRNGTVAIYKESDNQKTIVAEVRAGGMIGQMELFGEPRREDQAIASVATETLEISRGLFRQLMSIDAKQLESVRAHVSESLLSTASWEVRPESGFLLNFLLDEGLGEATNALVINDHLCVGCDNCEVACAETHDGISRLQRKEGPTKAHLHVPISCRHCQQPHCMKDCPPNAINRASTGEVFINDSCIGCGNCATNCPYGVISMEYPADEKPGLLNWLLFGSGPGPGQASSSGGADKVKKAFKCDACVGQDGGPACVAACPTGAAKRLSPIEFVDAIEGSR
ncbi:MAG: cyclic nucleotide-binding domain-containing protein [Gammaproteobacteria bacterium]